MHAADLNVGLSRRRLLAMLAAVGACAKAGPRPIAAASMRAPVEPAELIVRGGTILTNDPTNPQVEAVALGAGVVLATGSASTLDAWVGPRTQVLDLAGGTATPGLVDAHAHLLGLGQTLAEVDLRGATSINEVIERIHAYLQAHPAARGDGWIVGRGWDQNLWPGGVMPTHHPLTQVFPDRPVWLRRIDGHAGWGNAALLRASGVGASTTSPDGGELLREPSGAPTGVLVDAAMGLVHPPASSRAELIAAILRGQTHALQLGLTGVHEMGVGKDTDAVYRELAASTGEQALKLRIHAYASDTWFRRELEERAPDPIRRDARYTLAGVKLYADGALGSRGAALLQPYADRPGHRGLMQYSQHELDRLVRHAVAGGWQVATHAIGDAANRAVLDAYAAALPHAHSPDPRLRMEHCQILSPQDIPRFGELGIIASMQPTHATSDMGWVPTRLGPERTQGAYAWRSLLDAGAHVCFGSDFPVERANVTHGLYAATTRQDAQGAPAAGWLPRECVSLAQALRSFSSEAAYAAHRDDHLGSLRPGYRGDLTCFAAPLLALPPAALRDAPILGTIVEGEVAYWA